MEESPIKYMKLWKVHEMYKLGNETTDRVACRKGNGSSGETRVYSGRTFAATAAG